MGDPGKFRTVTMSLVKNAVKFTKEGEVIVSVILTELDGKEAIRVSVSDTGIGISEEIRPRLFSGFMQADSSDTRSFGGSGLGLAISRSMVELMKGRIEMVPNDGGGSIFRFDIPLERPDKKCEPLPRTIAEEKKPLVLIAEDHPVNQKLFYLIMEKLGYPALVADDGIDALEKVERNDVDIVFMDIQMPRMNGYEAAENLRKRGYKKPIIAVTASTISEERELCLKSGIDDVLIKPFKRADIEKILLKWIDKDAPRIEPGVKTEEAPAAAKPDAVLDVEGLLDTFMNNVELILPLLTRFVERTQKQIDNILEFKKAENWEDARREAHTIRGAALTLGGIELGKAASRLELAFKDIDRDVMEAACQPVQDAFDRFRKEAEDFIASRS
jgi:CheY-like chemotaxis protein/anti-sigma regulatory factor (Ser/Thr protein kinase)